MAAHIVNPHVTHRSPYEWLVRLQRAKGDISTNTKGPLLTISDIIERCNDPNAVGSLEPSSPRSVDACLRLGIEPCELKFIALDHFVKNLGDQDLANLAFKHHETVRQDRLQALLEERKQVIEDADAAQPETRKAGAEVKGFDTGDMVAKEAKRLEVQKRRQEREMQQMVAFEKMRKELQEKAELKLRKVQERTDAERKAKAEKTAEWRKAQHEREIQLLKEDEEREKEAKKVEIARYEREMELAARMEAAEKERKKLAMQKEVERAEKVIRARKETEALLYKQQAEIDKKKAEMAARDKQREAVKLVQQAEAIKRNQEASVKAVTRITAALQNNEVILTKRREDFNRKEELAEQRRKQKEEERKAEEAREQERDAAKERERKATFTMAQQREAERVASILNKQAIKDKSLAEAAAKREHEIEMRSLQRQMDLDLKREKVEAMRRRDLYMRMNLLSKIDDATIKAHDLVDQRAELQEQRKTANMEASFQRQRLQEAMQTIQAKKDWNKSVDIQAILSATLKPTSTLHKTHAMTKSM